jgi:hypothetical protein
MSLSGLLMIFNLAVFHPVHVSYTSVDINKDTGEIQVVCKFYTDDLKLLFYHLFERQLAFNPDKELSDDEKNLVYDYFNNSFVLNEKEGRIIDFLYIRKEQNEESIWLYFSGKLANKETVSLKLTNVLLLDLFEDQKNLVILNCKGFEKGIGFDYLTRDAVLELFEK